MKKLSALLLAIVMVFTLVACSSSKDEEKITKFIDENRAEVVDMMETMLAQSGMPCKVSVSAKGTGLVFDINISGIDNLTDAQKEAVQASSDQLNSTWDQALSSIRKDLPELTSLTVNMRESDGDLISSSTAKS